MNADGLARKRGRVKVYWRSLLEVAVHMYPRVKSIRLAYERMKAPRELTMPIRTILFVCNGNICRSPEVYFMNEARMKGLKITAKSAGIETQPGRSAHALSKEVARQQGFSLENYVAISCIMS